MFVNTGAKRVIEIFEELCTIPRGSGNTGAISAHIAAFAEGLGLACIRDGADNLIIKKPGTKGYENHPAVILQGHAEAAECRRKFPFHSLFTSGSRI